MFKKFRLLVVFIALFMFACHRGGKDIQIGGEIYSPKPVVTSPYKVRVTDVFNDTHQVYDVDIIGLLWNGIEDSLKKKGMLWTSKAEVEPYLMEGHVDYFRKGEIIERCLPRLGDTELRVRVELSRGGTHIATIESKRKIGYGKYIFSSSAWKKVFDEVTEDVVNQAVKKF
jgi:hypothetical protein